MQVDKEQQLLAKIRQAGDIDPDQHDGTYELVRETVRALSAMLPSHWRIDDLDLLYMMAVGSWKGGPKLRKRLIAKSNLSPGEKESLLLVYDSVQHCASLHQYNNWGSVPNIGMFGTGFYTFRRNSDTLSAQRFIRLCVALSQEEDTDRAFDLAEYEFGIPIKGMQAASASIVLHCLKPRVFPIINGQSRENLIVLNNAGLKLHDLDSLAAYICNARQIRAFRDSQCRFLNYRALDIALWKD